MTGTVGAEDVRTRTAAVDGSAVAALRASVEGQVLGPADDGYEEHRRVWNGSIDRRPAVIIRCAGVDDVRTAVRFGRDTGLTVAVRGGGHSFPGLSTVDGGLLVDLRPMAGVRVDPDARVAGVQAGALLGEVDAATQEHGLVVPSGIVSHTGVAGLTLGGGIGWVMRRYGLTVDSLESADLVTAEGEVVHASGDENAELFWGLRGGGGNFGVVTDFRFRLHPLGPQVMAGATFWSMDDAEQVLRSYRDWIDGCPDELMTIVVQRLAPALPAVPAELVGRPVIAVAACYAGDVDDGEAVLRPMRGVGTPVLDVFAPKPFLAHQRMFDPSFPHGCSYYVRSCDVAALTDEVIGVVVEHGRRITSPMSSIALWQMGEAVARVADDATAFSGRSAGFTFNINGNTPTADGFAEQRQWARDYWTALAPFHTGVYVNFLMEEGGGRVRQAYGEEKYRRLAALKRAYDPANLFRLNQNVPPG
ncbi:FAD/FMN-containing dehydrogenase [Geodermatophilus aquaeductus]|uniref:FAD/FMN-containing dehydrogenase n=1 Tax=Geodermatophilus aquaeductus TaxID=1564161 RepID=A0A521FKV3_9ACTN|nr:FAD-binding oxidoreductase [Geodermatophilus aquaeductus]SMO96833.1 FAD/FMN-containing dehydrogenase [Geodermatophilus aquaeductus]